MGHSRFVRVKRALGGFVGSPGGWWRVVVGWAKGAETPQNRRVVDFWPVSSGHGSYQYVRYGGRQFGAPTWGSVRAATMANAATIVAATANSTFFYI